MWSRRQESNLYLPLRRRPFYPLNYGERGADFGMRFRRAFAVLAPCLRRAPPQPIKGCPSRACTKVKAVQPSRAAAPR
jgi:hypothetical protein